MNSHICHVITTLNSGGAEQYVVQLSNYLVSSGHRVSIVAGEPQVLRERLDADINVLTLQMHPGEARSLSRYFRILLPAVSRLFAYFRREHVTLVHTHLAASALPAWIAAKLCGIPVIHSKMHTESIRSRYERIIFASRIPLLLVDRFLAFTRYSEDEIRRYWHVAPLRILSSSIGVDAARHLPSSKATAISRNTYGLSPDDRVMLVVARLYPEKGVELAIHSAHALDDPRIVLLIAGDGPQREFLEGLVQDVPSRTRIRFLGLLQDTRPAYAAADVLLQTTRGPNLGTSVLEAMASGLPVLVAHRDEDERKMAVDTFDGLDIGVLSQATPEAISKAVRGLFENPSRLNTLRKEVRAFVERRHARQVVYPALADCYTKLERSLN